MGFAITHTFVFFAVHLNEFMIFLSQIFPLPLSKKETRKKKKLDC